MQVEVGAVFDGRVTGITDFGAFVEFDEGKSGMVHISEVSNSFVRDIHEHLSVGQEVKVVVLGENDRGKISLSIKKALPKDDAQSAPAGRQRTREQPAPRAAKYSSFDSSSRKEQPKSFEDMMDRFKKVSDEKITDLKKASASKHGGGYSRRGK